MNDLPQETKDILKRINGKLFKWEGNNEFEGGEIDVIVLAHESVPALSVKPYGYTPKELYKKMKEICKINPFELEYRNPRYFSLRTYENPKFCFQTRDIRSNSEVLKVIDETSEGEILHINFSNWNGTNSPTCLF